MPKTWILWVKVKDPFLCPKKGTALSTYDMGPGISDF